jgi:hypothetical protein
MCHVKGSGRCLLRSHFNKSLLTNAAQAPLLASAIPRKDIASHYHMPEGSQLRFFCSICSIPTSNFGISEFQNFRISPPQPEPEQFATLTGFYHIIASRLESMEGYHLSDASGCADLHRHVTWICLDLAALRSTPGELQGKLKGSKARAGLCPRLKNCIVMPERLIPITSVSSGVGPANLNPLTEDVRLRSISLRAHRRAFMPNVVRRK